MRLACSTLTFSRLPLRDALQRIARLGFSWVDVGVQEGWAHVEPGQVRNAPEDAACRMGALLEETGLRPVAANIGYRARPLAEEIELVDALCRFAAALGIPVLTLPAGRAQLSRADDEVRLRRLVEVAARYGLCLTIETHVDTWAETPEGALGLVRAVPGLRLTFDPTHFLLTVGAWTVPQELVPHIAHVHLRDSGPTRAEIQVPVGEGRIAHGEIVAQLRAQGYRGAVATEVIDSIGRLDAETETRRLVAVLESTGLRRD